MAHVAREVVEERAYMLWLEAGSPEGSGLQFWLQAEQELGVIPEVAGDDPFVVLQDMAKQARQADGEGGPEPLAQSVAEAVPEAERLPGGFDDNPISQQVEKAGKRRKPRPGASTLQGGKAVAP